MVIRKATLNDTEFLAKIHVDSWLDTYSGIIPTDYLSKLSYSKSKENFDYILNNNINELFLVEYNSDIVGFCSFGKERTNNYLYKAEIFAIYILKDFRGMGIGKKLFKSVIEEFKRQEIYSCMLWALENNAYVNFYKSIGGQIIDDKEVTFGSVKLKEVAYAWDFIN